MTYDVIVIGLGGMGSAAAYQLARRGQRVLGLEQFTPAHDRGSSHGRSRIIRQAYFEGPDYVPLLLRAYELWAQLEAESGTKLLTITGGLMIGSPTCSTVAGSLLSAQAHRLDHELLDTTELARRFPPLKPPPGTVALYERMAGMLDPEACVQVHLAQAAALGAELHYEEPVLGWQAAPTGEGVLVTTASGTYAAGRLVLAPGAWASRLLQLDLPLTVTRQVLCWFAPPGGMAPFAPERFPIYIWELEDGMQFYGFPAQAGPPDGIKAAFFHSHPPQVGQPETIDRRVQAAEVAQLRAVLAQYLPALDGPLVQAVTCMYTSTPDRHFAVGLHPHHPQVVVASPCSGHGYKFASVMGELLADLAIDGTTRHSIEQFAPGRFAAGGAALG